VLGIFLISYLKILTKNPTAKIRHLIVSAHFFFFLFFIQCIFERRSLNFFPIALPQLTATSTRCQPHITSLPLWHNKLEGMYLEASVLLWRPHKMYLLLRKNKLECLYLENFFRLVFYLGFLLHKTFLPHWHNTKGFVPGEYF
jgi:hypothetical protein